MPNLHQLEALIDNAKNADDLRAILPHIEGASAAEVRSLTKRLNRRAGDLKVKVQADPQELIAAPHADTGDIPLVNEPEAPRSSRKA